MARRKDQDETFERFTRRTRKPRGARSVTKLTISTQEAARLDEPLAFKDPGLEELHERGLVDELLRQLKSGKEATVYMGRGPRGLVAVKIYTDLLMRSFKNEGVYREGRHIGDARLQRAIDRRSRIGMSTQQLLWIEEEHRQLCALHAAGVPVPEPMGQAGRVIVMEFVGDESGPAPRLSDIRLGREEALDAFGQSVRNLGLILGSGRVHGDYSAYNILWWRRRAVVIDFPQVVELAANRSAGELLHRDVESLCHTFARFGIDADPREVLLHARAIAAGEA
jgi:RIO kinase 1